MTECQGCGAWNERHRTLCVLCGTPLAETDEWDAAAELPPLPPLPDGGLSVSMPAWLRALPDDTAPGAPLTTVFLATEEERAAAVPVTVISSAGEAGTLGMAASPESAPGDAAPADQPLGPRADPRTFLRDDDFPRWIRELPTLPPRPVLPATLIAPRAAAPAPVAASPEIPAAQIDPTPGAQTSAQQDLHAEVEAAPSPGLAPVPTDFTARRREPWETPLLVVLVVGVVAAVIWALLVNGLIGIGL